MQKDSPIGVFDSGIGGLSVLKQLIRFLPSESYIYLGDTARVPYGNKSNDIVSRYASESTEFLLNKGVKLVVVACNTVSSVAMDSVRSTAGNIPVIDMIQPASSAALRATNNGRIGIIGTRATIGSSAYPDGIKSLTTDNSVKVFNKACPLFVPMVEEGMMAHSAARIIAEEYLSELKQEKIDTLVLGCTHYPLLSRLLSELMPGITLIDSGEPAAVSALRLLADRDMLKDEKDEYIAKPPIEFYVTDLPMMFYELAKQFLGFSVESPKMTTLG